MGFHDFVGYLRKKLNKQAHFVKMESLPAFKPSRKAYILNDEQPFYVDNDSLQRSEVLKHHRK